MSEQVGTTPGSRVVDGRVVPEVGVWEIDPSHQAFEFVARHLMAKVRGRFPGASGAATIAERPADSTLEIDIDANTIDTKDETRDAHMRSDDFFGVEEHPRITFRSTGVRPGEGENNWKVDGDLTIRGNTPPGHRGRRVPRFRPRPLGQQADRLLRRGAGGRPRAVGPGLELAPGDGWLPARQERASGDRGRADQEVVAAAPEGPGLGRCQRVKRVRGRNPIASALERLMSLNTPTAGRPGSSTRRTAAMAAQ